MNLLVTILMTAQLASTPPAEEQEVGYFDIANQAIINCPSYKSDMSKINPSAVFDLVGVERKFKVPSDFRGMLLAYACIHNSLSGNVEALRYWKPSTASNEVKTIFDITGSEKLTRFNRFNFQRTADIWMRRVVKGLNKNKCNTDGETCNWMKAWLNSVKDYKKTPKEELKLLKKWHNNIKE